MRLTRFTDNALRCLIFLGRSPAATPTVAEIADAMAMSREHLTKVVQRLATTGYVQTVRGRNGGVRLTGVPADISVGRVVRDCEHDMNLVPCFADPASCPIAATCRLAGVCDEAVAAFHRVLDGYTLADLLLVASRRSRAAG